MAIYTLRTALMQYPYQWESFERRAAVALVGVALSWLIYLMLSRKAQSSFRTRIAWTIAMCIPAAAIYAGSSMYLFGILAPLPGETCATGLPCTLPRFLAEASDLMINWLFVFGAWSLLCLSMAASAAQHAADSAGARYREAARLAEIRALRYQINPHFFFNVLNSLLALIGQDRRDEATALIGELGQLLRQTLGTDPLAEASLADEVALQARYVGIEQLRFPSRLALDVSLMPEVEHSRVPALILQPLVENSITHGVARSTALVTVRIHAHAAGNLLHLIVSDNAQHVPATQRPGLGIGLNNVRERLALHYGDAASCTVTTSATGCVTELRVPLRGAV